MATMSFFSDTLQTWLEYWPERVFPISPEKDIAQFFYMYHGTFNHCFPVSARLVTYCIDGSLPNFKSKPIKADWYTPETSSNENPCYVIP